MKLPALFLLLSACACAPLTEDQIYDRDVREIEANERFLEKEADCKRRRGVMVYSYRSKTRTGTERSTADIVTARCETMADGTLGDIY